MKKTLLALLMSFVMMTVAQAQVVKSVVGLEFGTSKQTAIQYLKDRFGEDCSLIGDVLYFFDLKFGSFYFTSGKFYFKNSKFVAAKFESAYEITKFNTLLTNTYGKKYSKCDKSVLSNGKKVFKYGDSIYYDNKFPIEIYSLEETYGDKILCSITVSYYMYKVNNIEDEI